MKLPSGWQNFWQNAPQRERRWLLLGAALVGAALLWWLTLAPALATLSAAQRQHPQLEQQMQQMLQWQEQARVLQALPKLSSTDTQRLLEASVKPLGSNATLVVQAGRLSVTLKALSAQALAQWLSAARQNAHAKPTQAHLKRNASGSWDGVVVFSLATA